MNRRKILLHSTLLVLMVGAILALIPFVKSLGPSEKAGEDLPHIDISKLKEDNYLIYDVNDKWWRYSTKFLVIRLKDRDYRIYYMNRNEEGETMLPDLHWWRPGWPCKDFRPSTEEGKITSKSVIKCFDENQDYRPDVSWKVTGEPIRHNYSPMEQVKKYSVSASYLVIGKG